MEEIQYDKNPKPSFNFTKCEAQKDSIVLTNVVEKCNLEGLPPCGGVLAWWETMKLAKLMG